jgi:tetratricopeptide (TPR) repeat protein
MDREESVTGESLDVLAQQLDRVLAARPVDPVAAAAALERAVAACRSDPIAADRWHESELLDELVDVYEQMGRTDDAIAAMRSAIAAGWRGRPDGRCRIAELLMRAGRVAEATPLWDQVKADTPHDVWLYNNAGLEYADVGDDATALTWLTDGLELALATGDPERLVDQLRNLRGAALSRLDRSVDRLQERATQFLATPTRTAHRFAAPPSTPLPPDGRPAAVTAPSPFRRPRATDQEVPLHEIEPADEAADEAGASRRIRTLALAWFPADQYSAALRRWPELTTEGAAKAAVDHAAYSQVLERTLRDYAEAGPTRLAISPIRIPDYLAWCTGRGADPAAPATRANYAADLARQGRSIGWPPARNQSCWCGSGRKYKQCCGRAATR